MRKFLRRSLLVLLVITLAGIGLWLGLKPQLEGRAGERLRAFGFSAPSVETLPALDGTLTVRLREDGKTVAEAVVDLASATRSQVELPHLTLWLENWPKGSGALPLAEQVKAVWQALTVPLPWPQSGYQGLQLRDVRVQAGDQAGFSGSASAQQDAAGWAFTLSGTVTALAATAPLAVTGRLTREGQAELSLELKNYAPVLPLGKLEGLDLGAFARIGQADPVLGLSASAAAFATLRDIKLSLNDTRQAGGVLPITLELTHNRLPLKLSGTVDLPHWRAALVPSGDFTYGAVQVRGLKGQVTVNPLWPPLLPDGQRLEARSLEAGLPFLAPHVVFGLNGNRLRLQEAGALLFGGQAGLAPLTLNLPPQKVEAVVTLNQLELGQVLLLANVEGLSGSGRLSGRVPVTYDRGQVIFGQTVLQSAEAGSVAYQPATPPSFIAEGGSGQLLGQVFSDFRYDALKLNLGGRLGDNLTLGVRLEGSNPSFYNGHPVAFNLNLSGALDSVLQNGLANFHFTPEALRDMMQMEQGEPKP